MKNNHLGHPTQPAPLPTTTQGTSPHLPLKDSGIPWLGHIPKHWQVRRLKFLGHLLSGLSGKCGEDFSNEKKTNKFYIPFTNVSNNTFINPKQLEKVFIAKNENQNKVLKGDLLFLMSSETSEDIGKTSLLCHDLKEVYLNSFCKGLRITSKLIDSDYLIFLLNSRFYRNKLSVEGRGFTRVNLKKNNLMSLHSLIPPKAEQVAIASYLDHQCEKIATFIQHKQTLITLLKEQRQALISQAVTQGIKPNLPRKDSGIPWLGHIPKHWQVRRLKNVCAIVLGKMLCSDDKGNYSLKPYLKSKNIGWDNVILDKVENMWFSDKELLIYRIKENDLLVSEGGEVGKTCIWKNELEECYIQNSVHKLTFFEECVPEYYLFWMVTLGELGHFKSIVNQVSIAHLTRDKIAKIVCIYPPKAEQEEIVAYIQAETAKIDQTIAKAEKEIALIQEYKEAMIAEAVLGKLNHRIIGSRLAMPNNAPHPTAKESGLSSMRSANISREN